jgi:hypothetical protein
MKKMSLYSKLKREGHALMDEMAAMGIAKNDMYDELAIKMRTTRWQVAFSVMRDIPTLKRAVAHLKELKARLS